MWSKDSLTIQLQLPVTRADTVYTSYKNVPLKLRWRHQLCSFTSEEFTIVKSDEELHVIPENNRECDRHSHPLCKIPRINDKYDAEIRCVKGLFKKLHLSDVSEFCEIKCQNSTNQVHVQKVTPNRFYITNVAKPLHISCLNKTQNSVIEAFQFGTLELFLPCSCALKDAFNDTLIYKVHPCDIDHDKFQPEGFKLLPKVWLKLDDVLNQNLYEQPATKIKNLTSLLDHNWRVKLPVYNLIDKVKVTEEHFKIDDATSGIDDNSSFWLILMAIWLSIATIFILLLLCFVILLHYKLQFIVQGERLRAPPPPLPPREHARVAQNGED